MSLLNNSSDSTKNDAKLTNKICKKRSPKLKKSSIIDSIEEQHTIAVTKFKEACAAISTIEDHNELVSAWSKCITARDDLSIYEPVFIDYDTKNITKTSKQRDVTSYEYVTPIIPHYDIPSLVKITWPEEVADVPYESTTSYGAGERKIAKLLGGYAMGTSVCYDVHVPGKSSADTKWEVKEICGNKIRASSDGTEAFATMVLSLQVLLMSLSAESLSDAQKSYVDEASKTIMKKLLRGMLTIEMLITLRSIINMIAPNKMNNVIQAFDAVMPSKAFSSVDGVFVVSPTDFVLVRHAELNDVFSFAKASLWRPNYYVYL